MSVPAADAAVAAQSSGRTRTPDRPTDSESPLVEQLRHGSREAMSTIFAAHLDVVYNYCYRRTSSWSAAEDLSATVFLEVWRHRRKAVELNGSVLPWLYGIATNVCRNHLRSRRRGADAMARLELIDAVAADHPLLEDGVADRIDADRRLRRALAALAALPTDDQNVFVLVCWEQLSYPQTAQALRIPIGTVRSRLARVRRHLRLADTSSEDPADQPDAAVRTPEHKDDHV